MAPKKKPGRHGRSAGRTASPRHIASARPPRPAPAAGSAPDLAQLPGLDAVLREPHPLALLEFASALVAAADTQRQTPFGGSAEGPTLRDLVEALLGTGARQTDALLLVLRMLQPDQLLAERIRREVAARRHAVPGWLLRLDEIRPTRAVATTEVLSDGANLMLGVDLPGGRKATLLIYVDHNLGTLVKDAVALDQSIEAVIARWRTIDSGGETELREISLADARALITEAIELGAITYPPLETDTWPMIRPFTEWVVGMLPPGGTGWPSAELSEAQRARITEDVLSSEPGRQLGRSEDRDMVETLLDFAAQSTPGDPLRWSPVSVEILLLDWVPRKIIADPDYLDRVPEVLRAVIRYAHAERGIPAARTIDTLGAVDRWEPEYRRAIRAPRRHGPAALIERAGPQHPPAPADDDYLRGQTLEELLLDPLRDEVGGREALDILDAEPLPADEFDAEAVPVQVRDLCRQVADLVADAADALFDTEFRTAAYRLLGRAAAADPSAFRRGVRAETAAAAVCWLVGRANGSFTRHVPGRTVQNVMARIGARGTPAERANRLLQAIGGERIGGDVLLADPSLLTSAYRRQLIEERDRALELIRKASAPNG